MLVKRKNTSVNDLVEEAKKLIPFPAQTTKTIFHVPFFDYGTRDINFISFVLTGCRWEILTAES